jgi:hypothetical protein
MNKPKRSDLLLSETVDEILNQFDVEHVFPKEFLKEEKRDGFWKRWRDSIAALFGFRRRAAPPSADQSGVRYGGGDEPGAGHPASQGSLPSAKELACQAKP